MANEVYAVVYEERIEIPGDERSRTHPGHGYPAETKYLKVFKEFKSQDEMLAWVKAEEAKPYKLTYQIFKCVPMNVAVSIDVKVS